ncbi:MAG: flagellar protein FlaG [Lachnospiraceae bacterium]|nr:flagellar protein FlaG [Lachnospiraceae bacterium]
MAIEALGGVMSYQAQPVAKPQVAAPQPVTMEGQVVETTPMVDANTAAVAQVNEQQAQYQDGQQNQQPSNEQIRKAVEDINKKANYSDVQFGVHEGTNRITIKIVDRETKKVIKELPPEKTLDMIAKAWELAGILVDEKR